MGRGAVALRLSPLLGFALALLAACEPARAPRVVEPATSRASYAKDIEPVAVWALLEPADKTLGASGKPSPAQRRQAPASGAQAVATAPRTVARPTVDAPRPAAETTPLAVPAARMPAPPASAESTGLPRHAPPRAPAGSRYRPRAPAGELASALYDPVNDDIALLQRPGEALRGLPADTRGEVDWVRSLAEKAIAPRASLNGESHMELRDTEVVMRETAAMPWVLFPHRPHTEWLACSNCHPTPFAARADGNDIRMDDIFRGRWCGRCHDRVAFPTFSCERCHNVLHPGSPDAWWETAGRP